MLVLTRKVGDQVRIGESLVTVLAVRGNRAGRQIRLGIEAPRSVPVVRPDAKKQARPEEGPGEESRP